MVHVEDGYACEVDVIVVRIVAEVFRNRKTERVEVW